MKIEIKYHNKLIWRWSDEIYPYTENNNAYEEYEATECIVNALQNALNVARDDLCIQKILKGLETGINTIKTTK